MKNGRERERVVRIKRSANGDLHLNYPHGMQTVLTDYEPEYHVLDLLLRNAEKTAEPSPERRVARVRDRGLRGIESDLDDAQRDFDAAFIVMQDAMRRIGLASLESAKMKANVIDGPPICPVCDNEFEPHDHPDYQGYCSLECSPAGE